MGWHWNEAPVLAVLNLFTVLKPLSKDNFVAYMTQMIEDPRGRSGKALLNSPHFLSPPAAKRTVISRFKIADVHQMNKKQPVKM